MEADDTSALLHRYVSDGSETAFMELMRRHTDLVYGAARRRLNGDDGLAQDVVQRVFAELARHAGKLRADSTLGGWLYRRAVQIAADVHKSETRRRRRELAAAELAAPGGAPATTGAGEAPDLEDAIGRLPAADRDAIILRFMEDRPLRAVGHALGVSENAVQKRISRALEKLRRLLSGRGVACTAASLTLTLTARRAAAASFSLFQSLTTAAPALAAAGARFRAAMLLPALAMKPAALLALAGLIAAGVAVPFLLTTGGPDKDSGSPALTAKSPSPPGTPAATAPITPAPAAPKNRDAATARRLPATAALLPGLTAEERESVLRTARAQAEKVTLERCHEKLARLRKLLSLTPEQDERLTAWHLAQRHDWVEYLTGASVGEADPRYYHLDVSYRPSVPPSLTGILTDEQRRLLAEHEATRRANFLEATTNGELGALALKLDLPEPAKDGLFQRLSTINGTDLFADHTGVADLAGIAAQADYDIGRRRTAFAEVLDDTQMQAWESIVTKYRSGLLQRFGCREPAAASNHQPEGRTG